MGCFYGHIPIKRSSGRGGVCRRGFSNLAAGDASMIPGGIENVGIPDFADGFNLDGIPGNDGGSLFSAIEPFLADSYTLR